jgi:hypothetical protein
MDPALCHAGRDEPFRAAEVGLALIAVPVTVSWLGYLPRFRWLLGHGAHILCLTWSLTVVLAVLAGTGVLGDPPCVPLQSPL